MFASKSQPTNERSHIIYPICCFILMMTQLLFADITSAKASKESFNKSLSHPKFLLPYSSSNIDLTSHKLAFSDPQLHSPLHSRHRRRLPFGIIAKLMAKITGKSAKVAAAAGKTDDALMGVGKVGRIPSRGTAPGRYYKSRGFDPPPFSSYAVPAGSDMAKRARVKALTGTNVALATAGVATGIWYFGGENAVLYLVIIVVAVLIVLALALSLLIYLFMCRKRKKGYYAVNEQMAAAFAKKLLFYMFC